MSFLHANQIINYKKKEKEKKIKEKSIDLYDCFSAIRKSDVSVLFDFCIAYPASFQVILLLFLL